MNLTLVFSRKYRWPEHYFSVWSLGNSQKLLTTNQFLISTIFLQLWKFLSVCVLISFQSLPKNQSNQEQCSLCYSSPCFRVFLCNLSGLLQCFSTYFRNLKEIGVLRPIFSDYVISYDYGETYQIWKCNNCTLLCFC